MKALNHSKILWGVNIALGLLLVLSCFRLTGKFLLHSGKYNVATNIFHITGPTVWELISLIENGDRDKAHELTKQKDQDLLNGIMAWTEQDYPAAGASFKKEGHDRFLAYTRFKEGNWEDIIADIEKNKIPILTPHYLLQQTEYKEAVRSFLENSDNAGLGSLFLRLRNEPSAIYYFYRHGHPHTQYLAKLLAGMSLEAPPPSGSGQEIKSWYATLQGDLEQAQALVDPQRAPGLHSTLATLTHGVSSVATEQLSHLSTDSFFPEYNLENYLALTKEITLANEDLKVFSVLPQVLDEREISTTYMTLFAITLAVLFTGFTIAVFYLYRKYKLSLVSERQKDLEKMDALSFAKAQSLEAKRKRDKTELNVSSFVTLNIQLEVLDAAFTKLGLRVDTRKLAEQIEKTKIPNISYKVYTISNSYGFDVKMQSTEFKDLSKLKKHGAVILVLKGDLIALLKRADNQNAYLQFSKKDSRKVPESALKLSWEGNLITLNKV